MDLFKLLNNFMGAKQSNKKIFITVFSLHINISIYPFHMIKNSSPRFSLTHNPPLRSCQDSLPNFTWSKNLETWETRPGVNCAGVCNSQATTV